MSVDPSLIAGIAGLITAIGGTVTAIIGTRSKVKLDDIAQLQHKLDEAEEDLETERAERAAELARARAEHNAHIDELQARHDRELSRQQGRIDALLEQLTERDRQLNKLDRLVIAMRAYIGRLSRAVLDYGGVVPERPSELD
ncbi:hypothetical protein [Rhodococcus sp. YH1]|uniref:hypothetical protein n=1 Tax=Rhodococcus sp. YH1 TaxID=89066 RepID=UPI0013868EEE|nr:hypothetical protein [Rhodococcus sp. YH1]